MRQHGSGAAIPRLQHRDRRCHRVQGARRAERRPQGICLFFFFFFLEVRGPISSVTAAEGGKAREAGLHARKKVIQGRASQAGGALGRCLQGFWPGGNHSPANSPSRPRRSAIAEPLRVPRPFALGRLNAGRSPSPTLPDRPRGGARRVGAGLGRRLGTARFPSMNVSGPVRRGLRAVPGPGVTGGPAVQAAPGNNSRSRPGPNRSNSRGGKPSLVLGRYPEAPPEVAMGLSRPVVTPRAVAGSNGTAPWSWTKHGDPRNRGTR